MTRISIAKDYSKEPAGRFPADGKFNGQRFRQEFLVPALKGGDVQVDLDGTEGYGSSFLEEAFGGLVRLRGYKPADLRNLLRFVSREDPSLIEEIWSYIDDARPE